MLKYHNIVATVSLLLAAAGGYYIAYKKYEPLLCMNRYSRPCTLQASLRKLWSQQICWMRNYIIAALAETSDMSAISDRLLKNQKDIGNALIPYYGKEAGQKLTTLLKEHVHIATEIIAAAKAHHTERLKEADERWHRNAADVAAFLHHANAFWENEELLRILYAHLTLTSEELQARLYKNWKADIATFDKIFDQALDIADHLTEGIVQQFPQKF